MKDLKKSIAAPLTVEELKVLAGIKAHHARYTATFNEEPAGWILQDMLFVEFPLSVRLIHHDNWYHNQILKGV